MSYYDFVQDEDGYIRFDAKCTPGKTVPCGAACRTPTNCKAKGKSRVTEKGKGLREQYAADMRAKKGLGDRSSVNAKRSKTFGKATKEEGALVDQYMAKSSASKRKSEQIGRHGAPLAVLANRSR